MEYISTKEAAAKWNSSLRCVQRFLHENRVPGAKKYGVSWLIPADAQKPEDPRRVRRQRAEQLPGYLLLQPTRFSKRNLSIEERNVPPCYRRILEADIAYRRGEPQPGIDVWRDTAEDNPASLTAATIATVAAISAGDFLLYSEIQKALQKLITQSNDARAIAMLSLPATLAAVSMAAVGMTPQWLKNGDFSLFSREQIPFLLYLYALHLRNTGDHKAVLHTAKTAYLLCAEADTFTWLDVYNLTLCAQACFDIGDTAQAREYLLCAMQLGLPAGFIAPFADYLGTLGGLVEACLDTHFPRYTAQVVALWNRYFKNWMVFHNQFTGANITTVLTPQEYQLARHIARGASYAQAARKMNLSVGRTKNILSEIYSKLCINKKSELSRFVT